VKNNYEYSKILAEYAIANNIRFIYASSAATYGAGELGYSDNHQMLEKLQPLNMYGYSKQMFDLYALRKGYLDKIAGLKFFNVYGANEYHKGDMRSVVHKAYYQIKNTGAVNLFKSYNAQYKDGEQKRDFIYIKEAISKVMCFIEIPSLNGIFNIGTGQANTWNALVIAIFKALNIQPKINYIEMPEYLKSKYQYFTEADMSKFDKLTEFLKIEKYSIDQGVYDYVVNYLEKENYL
ncbi:MAG TPA: NAD-dependent epimerase/dehydratase family protein, partial [bacterium]|nr:NAD-dependent epimerase/dehydratase family protein [bacterium]